MADAPARFKDLCLDASDHQALADWWCAALGYRRRDEVAPPEDGLDPAADWPVPIVDPTGAGPLIWIVPVPEPKTVKNRMHIDVVGDTQALLAAGATLVRLGRDSGRRRDRVGRARRSRGQRVLRLHPLSEVRPT